MADVAILGAIPGMAADVGLFESPTSDAEAFERRTRQGQFAHEFPLLRVDHLATIAADLEATTRFWSEALGVPVHEEIRTPGITIRKLKMGDSILELLAPTGGPGGRPAGPLSMVASEVFSLRGHQAFRFPVERRDVPVLIGTWGARTAALAGEFASEVKVGGSANPALLPTMREWINVGATRTGRSPNDVGIVLGAVTVVDRDGQAARDRARAEVARYLPVVGPLDPTVVIDPDLLSRIETAVLHHDFSGAGALVPEALLDRFAFAGTPEDVAARAYALLAAGATRIEFGTPHGLTEHEGLRLLGEHVLPALH